MKKKSQRDEVLEFFRLYHTHTLSPSHVQAFWMPEVPIGSIRRAINALTSEGKLVKLDRKDHGLYGRRETLWKLNGIV